MKQELKVIEINSDEKEIFVRFYVRKGYKDSTDTQGYIKPVSNGIKNLTKQKSIKMEYDEPVTLRLSTEKIDKNAFIEFYGYDNDKDGTQEKDGFLCGKILFTKKKIEYKNCVLIKISDKPTGWTISRVYGHGTNALIVQTYETSIYYVNDKNEKKLYKVFHLTRDGFYNLGKDPITKKELIINRSSEPLKEVTVKVKNSTVDYADTKGAYVLTPFEVEVLPKNWDFFLYDGESLPATVIRKNPKIVTDAMIHIGGYFTKGTKHKIGGTYGCYGVVNPKMKFNNSNDPKLLNLLKEAKKVIDDRPHYLTPLKGGLTSNAEQDRLVNIIQEIQAKYKLKPLDIYVNIKKKPKRRKSFFL